MQNGSDLNAFANNLVDTTYPWLDSEPIIVDSLVCADDNIISLPDSEHKLGGFPFFYRDKIRSDYGERMAIQRYREIAVD
jgi:hypothetical protein